MSSSAGSSSSSSSSPSSFRGSTNPRRPFTAQKQQPPLDEPLLAGLVTVTPQMRDRQSRGKDPYQSGDGSASDTSDDNVGMMQVFFFFLFPFMSRDFQVLHSFATVPSCMSFFYT
jgi:hypothetical protein